MSNAASLALLFTTIFCCACGNKKSSADTAEVDTALYPSDVLPDIEQWQILLGDGTSSKNLVDFSNPQFFYVQKEGDTPWVVYKTPNSGITSPNSSNTRSELGQIRRWTPEEGGRLTGTLKVQHVSLSGDARVAASYSVVVGQIHSDDGHENEPLKIFYKKFPGHEKGSVFWHYEINTAGDDNAGRWDYSTAVWGDDFSVVGPAPDEYPAEPAEGIALGEEFSYSVDVVDGIMSLTFESKGHPTQTFTKNLVASEYSTPADLPAQTRALFVPIGQDGVERPEAYAGEAVFFKQGAYNQTNGKARSVNPVWSAGAEIHGGDIAAQYADGNYTEVWFREGSISR